MNALADAERAARFLLEHVRDRAGARWRQGPWQPSLAAEPLSESVDVIARERLWRVESSVARGIVAWARGERRVSLCDRVPHHRELLALQARGGRHVSLLPPGADTTPHADPLAFALHDLCHLEKLYEPAHYRGQVGFFALTESALEKPEFRDLDARFDAAWRADLEHVVADMNGSSIYLFAALKMKLKMAVRRELAFVYGTAAPAGGALRPEELARFGNALETLLDAFAFPDDVREAARSVTTRRAEPEMAERLLAAFEARGRAALGLH